MDKFLNDAIKTICKTNQTRTLIIGPANWNGIETLPTLILPKEDKNIIVTVHFYQHMKFTHQEAPWPKENANYKGDMEARASYTSYVACTCEKHGIGWAYWQSERHVKFSEAKEKSLPGNMSGNNPPGNNFRKNNCHGYI